MYSVEIVSLCEGRKAPKFSSYQEAKHCFDSAVDFLFNYHPYEYLNVRLKCDDFCVLSTVVNLDFE